MNAKKVHIKSFGCQMNKLDSSLVRSALKNTGMTLTETVKDADIVLINTCSVRQHAEDRVLSHLGHLMHVKKDHPEMIVGVIGCMAQRLGAKLGEHPAVDIVAGPAQIPQIPQLVADAIWTKTKAVAITEKIRQPAENFERQGQALDEFEMAWDSDENHITGQAFVRVMRGCNKFCTYCVVPYVRGPEISRPPGAIIEQIKKLAGSGVKQITLLGQTVNSYNYTAGGKSCGLGDLLEMASEVEGVQWIRFITSYPVGFDESILHAMADLPKVCPYLHVPAQSGSDTILKAMNRNYTAAEYLGLLDRAREIVAEVSIAGDFIVGFPGESEKDFEATAELLRRARYKNCFVFKYSPRPGTHAIDRLADDVPDEVKKQRNTELLRIQNQICEEDNKRFLNETVKVLVEGPSKKPHLNKAENQNLPQLIGRTATDHIVVFNGADSLAGEFAQVRITKTAALTLFGQMA